MKATGVVFAYPTALLAALRSRALTIQAVRAALLVYTLFIVAFATAQQSQIPVYISQELPVVGLDAMHVSPAASFVRFRESEHLNHPSTASTPATLHAQQQEAVIFIPQGTVIANADLLLLTSDFIIEQQADSKTVAVQYRFKPLDASRSGTARKPQALFTSPLRTPRGGVDAFLKIATACSVNHNFKISPIALATQRLAYDTFGQAAHHLAPIATAFLHQRSPLEKHNRYFNLPPPATA